MAREAELARLPRTSGDRMLIRILVFCLAALLALAPAHAEQPWENTAGRAADIDALYAFMKATHPDLYHRTKQAEMEAYAAKLRSEAAAMSWPQFVVGVYRLVSMAGDGHSTLFPMPENGPGFDTRLALRTEAFSDGLFVIEADEAYRDAVGKKVVAIAGKPTADVVATLSEIWPHENQMWVVRFLPHMLRHPGFLHGAGIANGDVAAPIVFTVMDNGQRRDIAVKPIPAADDATREKTWVHARDDAKLKKPTPLHGTTTPFGVHYLKDRKAVYAVYRQVGDTKEETVAAFAARLFAFATSNNAERVIIDVRENGGGNNYKNQPLLLGMLKSKFDRPGALFVLEGRGTFSAAQNFVNHAERWTQAMFVGEPTGSSPNHFGDARQIQLPATKLAVMIASLRWQDSAPNDRRPWIMPDIVARQSFADYLAGRDVALEAALAYRLPAGFKAVDPFEHWQDERHWVKVGDNYKPRTEFKFDW